MKSKAVFTDRDQHVLCVASVVNKSEGHLVLCALAEADQVRAVLAACPVEALVALLGSLFPMEEAVIYDVLALDVKVAKRSKQRNEYAAVCFGHCAVSFVEGLKK